MERIIKSDEVYLTLGPYTFNKSDLLTKVQFYYENADPRYCSLNELAMDFLDHLKSGQIHSSYLKHEMMDLLRQITSITQFCLDYHISRDNAFIHTALLLCTYSEEYTEYVQEYIRSLIFINDYDVSNIIGRHLSHNTFSESDTDPNYFADFLTRLDLYLILGLKVTSNQFLVSLLTSYYYFVAYGPVSLLCIGNENFKEGQTTKRINYVLDYIFLRGVDMKTLETTVKNSCRCDEYEEYARCYSCEAFKTLRKIQSSFISKVTLHSLILQNISVRD